MSVRTQLRNLTLTIDATRKRLVEGGTESQVRQWIEDLDRLRGEYAAVTKAEPHYTLTVHVVLNRAAVDDFDDACDVVSCLLTDSDAVSDWVYARNESGAYAHPRPVDDRRGLDYEDEDWIFKAAETPYRDVAGEVVHVTGPPKAAAMAHVVSCWIGNEAGPFETTPMAAVNIHGAQPAPCCQPALPRADDVYDALGVGAEVG